MRSRLLIAALAAFAAAPLVLHGQQPGENVVATAAAAERQAVSRVWQLLASGQTAEAAAQAVTLAGQYPRSLNVAALAVEAEIARGGALVGLGQYERWLGARTDEEPGLVRRIARAVLEELSGQPQDPSAKLEALRLLSADGDAAAHQALDDAAATGRIGELAALASAKDERAVGRIIEGLKAGTISKEAAMRALGESGRPEAVAPLSAELKNTRPELRSVAVDALAQIGGASVIAQLRPLLQDPSAMVRLRAAAGLLKLGDPAGLSLIQALANAPAATDRLFAATALAARPDAAWLSLVRQLGQAREPEIRLGAARLLVTADPAAAEAIFLGLSADPNPAIREETARVEGLATTSLIALRRLLRTPDRLARAGAAGRILELTR